MALKNTFDVVGRSLRTAPEIWGLRLALFAAFCFMLKKAGKPADGEELSYAAALALGLAALIFEYIAAKRVAHGWFSRSPGALLGWGLIWVGAFAYSANNWIGAAGEREASKGNIQKAAFVSYTDTRTAVDAARERVASESASLKQLKAMTWQELPKVAGKPIASPDAAKTIMDGAKEGSTRWTQAKAAFEDLTERAKWQQKVEKAESQLAEARRQLSDTEAKAGSVKTVSNDTREDLRWYVKYGHMSAETAQDVQSFMTVGVTSLFVSLFALLHVAEAYRGKQLPPWFNWRGLIVRTRRLWDGTDHTVVVNNMHSAHVIRTANGLTPVVMQHAT
jgi:hypothetical protein